MGGVWEGGAEAKGEKGKRGVQLERCSAAAPHYCGCLRLDTETCPSPSKPSALSIGPQDRNPHAAWQLLFAGNGCLLASLASWTLQTRCAASKVREVKHRGGCFGAHSREFDSAVCVGGPSTCTVAAACPGMRLILGCTVQADCATPFPLHHSDQGAFWASWVFVQEGAGASLLQLRAPCILSCGGLLVAQAGV